MKAASAMDGATTTAVKTTPTAAVEAASPHMPTPTGATAMLGKCGNSGTSKQNCERRIEK